MSVARAPGMKGGEHRPAPIVFAFLRIVGSGGASTSGSIDWQPGGRGQQQLDWIVQAGLGPLLRWAARDDDRLPQAWAQTLLAADLTARVRHAAIADTALDVLDACRNLDVEATLLKGISVSDTLYPAPHMRPMGDIDVLVRPRDHPGVEAALLASGFVRLPYPDLPGHHHGAPLRHARRRTLVELHTALFPQSAPVHDAAVFDAAHLRAQRRTAEHAGRRVFHLTPEVQLAYIAAAWFNDMANSGFHPSFLASLVDALLLLRSHGAALDWEALLRPIDNDMAKASLYAMLTYVPRFGVPPAPASALRRLADNGGLVGPIQRRAIHVALDRCMVGARPWSLPFPPPMPGRYSPRHQLRKRWGRP